MPRIRRAPLFVPGDSMRKIEKSLTLNADTIILELEDGVAYNQKEQARQNVRQALEKLDFGASERLVRINAIDTGLFKLDLNTTLPGKPDGYLIPKVENAHTVRQVSRLIGAWEKQAEWPNGTIRLLVIIESALGVMNLREIANADARLDALIFGAEDLASSMGATRTEAGWEGFYARSAIVTAAAAFGLEAIDTPHIALHDTPGLTNQAQIAVELGYSGKLAIHPSQLDTIHRIFSPSAETIAAAERLLAAYHHHTTSGTGAFTLDGKMVDKPMVRSAQKIIAKARHLDAKNNKSI